MKNRRLIIYASDKDMREQVPIGINAALKHRAKERPREPIHRSPVAYPLTGPYDEVHHVQVHTFDAELRVAYTQEEKEQLLYHDDGPQLPPDS